MTPWLWFLYILATAIGLSVAALFAMVVYVLYLALLARLEPSDKPSS